MVIPLRAPGEAEGQERNQEPAGEMLLWMWAEGGAQHRGGALVLGLGWGASVTAMKRGAQP